MDILLHQAIYDEVDEETYERMRKERMNDDFIVDDDDGQDYGYHDHGGEIFDEEDYFEGDSAAAKQGKRVVKGSAAGSKPRRRVIKRRVNSLFTGGGGSRLGASVVKMDGKETAELGDDSFLAEIMAEDDDEDAVAAEQKANKEALRARKRKKKGGLAAMAMFGSTAEARDAFLDGPTAAADSGRAPSTIGRVAATTTTGTKASPKTFSPSFAGSPPGQRGDSRPSRPSFASPDGSGNLDDMDDMPDEMPPVAEGAESPMKSNDTGEVVAAEKPKPKKKKKVVQTFTEEELEEIENAPDGAKDHLKVSKATIKTDTWAAVRRGTAEGPEVKVDGTKLPTVAGEDGEEVLKFFWLDAFEAENHKAGTIYLFGKVWNEASGTFVSSCVTVEGLERNLFVLPRALKLDRDGDVTDEKVEMVDVYQEVEGMLAKAGVQSFQCKPVQRNYAFEKAEIPEEATWLKVKYSATFPKALEGATGKTFSHVFGSGIGPLERFLMKRDLMGPCWLDIKGATPSFRKVSWTKIEASISDPKMIKKTVQPPASPPLVVLSLNMQTVLNRKTAKNEILVVSGLVHNTIECDGPTINPEAGFSHFTGVRKLGDTPFPFDFRPRCHQTRRETTQLHPNERSLLGYVLGKIAKIDPDVVVGHNLLGFDLDVLLHRIKANNIPHWSKIGRLRRTMMPKLQAGSGGRANFAEKALASGRLLVDLKISAREFVKLTTYEMTELVQTQLQGQRVDVDSDMIPGMYQQSDSLLQLCDHVEQDAFYIMSTMLKLLVLPLSKQISNITGGLLARVFAGGRSERNEYLLCHEFHRKKYIVPDKKGWNAGKSSGGGGQGLNPNGDDDEGGGGGAAKKGPRRKKAAYAGGLVLEPKRGFYDKFILLLDFNSLYPSIIQEYNLCFTTVERKQIVADADGVEPMADVPDSTLPRGILPRVIRGLIEKRKAVKALIKSETDPSKLTDYDIRQLALKLTANSMYGCLGFTASRFYAKPIASLITSKGREILQKTVDLAEESLNLDVIYGDTDSIMINTRTTDLALTKKIGNQVKKEVNALYKELEIEIDGVFKTMLLLKKKKYAALTIKEKNGVITIGKETKGLDIVRRDWCKLSHITGSYVLNQILSRESREDLVEACHDYLRSVADDIAANKIPVDQYIIHKGLTKDPKDYADKKHQPHVQVALRMIASGKSVKALDTVPYIVCVDGTANPATQRAYHPDDLRKKDDLSVDHEYYLKNQVHPVVSRLVDPIDGTDSGQIAECLGLNASEFLHTGGDVDMDHNEIGMGMMSQMSDAERFKGASKLSVPCRKCGDQAEISGVFKADAANELRCGLLCQKATCTEEFSVPFLSNHLTLAMRQEINKYYLSELKCDDEACGSHEKCTRQLSTLGTQCMDGYCRGTMKPVYSDARLYTQLSYFLNLFDVENALKKLPDANRSDGEKVVTGHRGTFDKIYDHVDKTLQKSARKHVDLGNLFLRLGLGRNK